ncbi:MAG: ABC transporter substrate-binding protein [Sneathiellaceae bacterium]
MASGISRLAAIAAAGAMALAAATAVAEDSVKVGVVGPMTGPLAVMGKQWRQGIEAYMAAHGDTVNGHKIEVIYRDTTANPSMARQLTQDLVVRDGVQALIGYGISPSAAAAAPVINQAKIPAFLPHAASPGLMAASPYFARMGQNIATNAEVAADWALKKGVKTAYIAVADYAPGHDVAKAFQPAFEAGGGKVVGQDNIPLSTVDFSPFAERIATADPDMVQMFIPPGAQAVSMVKALAARGVMADTLVIGQGEAEDSDIHLFDGTIDNFHTVIYYSQSLDNPENKTFLDSLKATAGADVLPSSFTLGAYDAMGLIYALVADMKGDRIDGPAAMEALAGHSWNSPRGKVTLDMQTREPIQDFVVRQVQQTDAGLRNVVIDTIPQVTPKPTTN